MRIKSLRLVWANGETPFHRYTQNWIKQRWYIHTIEYFSVKGKNDIMSFAGKWMELDIMLSDI
jgi:hypothetical protein